MGFIHQWPFSEHDGIYSHKDTVRKLCGTELKNLLELEGLRWKRFSIAVSDVCLWVFHKQIHHEHVQIFKWYRIACSTYSIQFLERPATVSVGIGKSLTMIFWLLRRWGFAAVSLIKHILNLHPTKIKETRLFNKKQAHYSFVHLRIKHTLFYNKKLLCLSRRFSPPRHHHHKEI